VDCVERANDYGTSGQFVAAGDDAVYFSGAAGLKGRVVEPLSFLVEFVEEGETIGEFGRPLRVFIYACVDELLEQALLVAGVDAETVGC
jgi:hypothetical protein